MHDPGEDEASQAVKTTVNNQALKYAELERLLNDPDAPVDPDRVWTLVGELAHHEQAAR